LGALSDLSEKEMNKAERNVFDPAKNLPNLLGIVDLGRNYISCMDWPVVCSHRSECLAPQWRLWLSGNGKYLHKGTHLASRRPSGEPLTLPVLWPWQKPYRGAHVELFLPGIFAQWSLGIIVLSFLYRMAGWVQKEEKPDPLMTFGWVIALYLGIGMLAIFGLGVLSNGYAPMEDYMVALFSLGALGTLFYFVYYQFQKSSHPNTPNPASLPVSPTR
jgi:hypothetical protein